MDNQILCYDYVILLFEKFSQKIMQ